MHHNYPLVFPQIAECIFISLYLLEVAMKIYLEPLRFWRSGFNIVDTVVVIVYVIPYYLENFEVRLSSNVVNLIEALRSLRILKLIYFSRGLQNLITALVKTMKRAVYVLFLLFILMFIFAILGCGLFGDPVTGDTKNWGNLGSALFTLFSLVTVDSWTDWQDELDDLGFTSSRFFTVIFILLGYFVFFNMFIGIVIIDIQESTHKYEREIIAETQATLSQKKQAILQRQKDDLKKLFQQQKSCAYRTFNELVKDFKRTLQHSDHSTIEDFCTSLPFIDMYLSSLDHQDHIVL
ncbi:hypothetical protein FKM82_012223, partial [Ascaphus truei]